MRNSEGIGAVEPFLRRKRKTTKSILVYKIKASAIPIIRVRIVIYTITDIQVKSQYAPW